MSTESAEPSSDPIASAATSASPQHQTERPITEIVDELRGHIHELGRMRSIRDPLAHLADQLSPPQCHTLFWLHVDQALSAGTLAERIGCSMPSLTGIVDRLEKLGFVERARDRSDRRVVLVRLTDKGAEFAGAMDAAFRARLGTLLEALTPDDRELLVGLARRIKNSFRARAAPRPAVSPTEPNEESSS